MRSAACLHSNKTWPKSGEEGGNLPATQTSAEHHFSFRIDPVQLENVFRDVDADGGNLAHGWLPFLVIVRRPPFWHSDAVRGPSTPSV
jgi:hypothetical protein